MKALVAIAAVGAVVVDARSAWACGACFGGGSGSLFGWIVLGAVALLGLRLMSRR